jgi:DNA-binding response OmpR family regulator
MATDTLQRCCASQIRFAGPRVGRVGLRRCLAAKVRPVNDQGYILIVEADDLIRRLLERWLGEAGYAVVAGTLEGSPREDPPHLIIANISRPRNAANLIRALQAQYEAPILVVSARFRRGLGASHEVARRLRVRRVLPKPFTREELLAAVGVSIGKPDDSAT